MQGRPVKEKEEERASALFSLDKWIRKLKGGGLDVKVSEEDKKLIEYQLMDVDREKIACGMIKECVKELGFKKFLLILNKKEKRICYFDVSMDRIAINFSYFPKNEKSQESLFLAGKMARSFSRTVV